MKLIGVILQIAEYSLPGTWKILKMVFYYFTQAQSRQILYRYLITMVNMDIDVGMEELNDLLSTVID